MDLVIGVVSRHWNQSRSYQAKCKVPMLTNCPMGVNKANLKEMKCNNIYVHETNSVKRANHHFALKGPVRETDIATMLRRMYKTNFTELQLQTST